MEEGVTGITEEKKKRRFTLLKGGGKKKEFNSPYVNELWVTLLRRYLIREVKNDQ